MVWIIGGHLLLLLFHNSREYTVNEALMYYLPLVELESHLYAPLSAKNNGCFFTSSFKNQPDTV